MIGNSDERVKIKTEREEAVVAHVRSTFKFKSRPTLIKAVNVFGQSFRINVYGEGPPGDYGLVKCPTIIHSELLCIDTKVLGCT